MNCFKKSEEKNEARELEFGLSYPIFGDNEMQTSKYNLLNFLPLNLSEQFSKASNIYFLILICLQFVKAITITDRFPTILPTLITVVAVSALKDFLEDYKRWKSDKEENSREISRVLFQPLSK